MSTDADAIALDIVSKLGCDWGYNKNPTRDDAQKIVSNAILSYLASRREALVPEPVYKAVERILDEKSAWIARPNDEVTKSIALQAVVAAHKIIAESCDICGGQDASRREAQEPVPPFAENGYGSRLLREAVAYLNEYVFDYDSGADHEPTEFERFMMEDMLNGLFSHEPFFGIIRNLSAPPSPAPAGEVDRPALEPVLSFLDELAANGQSGQRKALNPVLIGGSAKLYAEGLRAALKGMGNE